MTAYTYTIASVVAFVLLLVVLRLPPRARRPQIPQAAWKVAVKPGSQWISEERYEAWKKLNINESVHVRLLGPGSDVLIAAINVTDDDYERQIIDALALAEDRATTLNALPTG